MNTLPTVFPWILTGSCRKQARPAAQDLKKPARSAGFFVIEGPGTGPRPFLMIKRPPVAHHVMLFVLEDVAVHTYSARRPYGVAVAVGVVRGLWGIATVRRHGCRLVDLRQVELHDHCRDLAGYIRTVSFSRFRWIGAAHRAGCAAERASRLMG